MTFGGRVPWSQETAAMGDAGAPPRDAALAAACTGALGALWAVALQAVLNSTGWIAGVPAPALATPSERLWFAAPVVALAVVVSWTLVRSPLHGWPARVLFLAATAAQFVAVMLVLSLSGSGIAPVPSIGWFVVVMVGGASGAGLVGVVVGRFRSRAEGGVVVLGVGWSWLAVAGARGSSTTTCNDGQLLRLPQPVTGAVVVGAALVVAGAVLMWRRADGANRFPWRGAAVVVVAGAVWCALALLHQPAEVLGGCTISVP